MVTEITLGNYGTLNGKNVITGGASKLDTTGLIEALVNAKRQPAVRLEEANETIDLQSAALKDLKAILAKLQTASDTLRNTPGVNVQSKNIFEYRTTALGGINGFSGLPDSYVGVTVEPGAAVQTYAIQSVDNIAKAAKQSTVNLAIADATTVSVVDGAVPFLSAGTTYLRAVDGTVGGIAVTFNAGDSLQTVANKFNEVSSRTGIQATILKVSDGQYRLNFSATQTGAGYDFDFLTGPGGSAIVSDAAGVFADYATVFNAQSQAGEDAQFVIDGVTIIRSKNAIDDVIDGMTFNLKQTFTAGDIEVDVQADTELASNAIIQFADAYNEFRLFASKQSQLDDASKPTEDSVLYNNRVMRDIIAKVNVEVTGIINGLMGSTTVGASTANITTSDMTNPATYISATIAPNAPAGTYVIDSISTLVQRTEILSSVPFQQVSDGFPLPANDYIIAGTYYVNDGGSGVEVILNDNESVPVAVDKLNAANLAAGNGITVTAEPDGGGLYYLRFIGPTGAGNDFTFNTIGQPDSYFLSGPPLMDDSGRISTASDASFSINGTPYTSASNTGINVIPGVTLNLLATKVSGTITIDVDVGATTTTPGLSRLEDIGLTLDTFVGDDENPETKNILVVDTDKLNAALQANFNGVRSLFEYQMTSDNVNFATFKRSNNLTVTEFTVIIDATGDPATYKAQYTDPITAALTTVDLEASAIPGGGLSLKGKAGTIFEGSEYLFSGIYNGLLTTINVTATQGYGDRFYNMIDSFNNTKDGALTLEIDELADTKIRKEEEIVAIDAKIETYRQQLIDQYAKLEGALTRANQLLQLLDAQTNARNNG